MRLAVADDPQLFIGHPPSLRRLWSLDAALVNTPLRELRARADVELYPLRSLLELVRRRPAACRSTGRRRGGCGPVR